MLQLLGLVDAPDHNATGEPTTSHSVEPDKGVSLQESSSSQESCQTFFTRRMEELEGEDYSVPVEEVTVLANKESCGEVLELNPGLNKASVNSPVSTSFPAVSFLDSEHNYVGDPRLRKGKITPPKPKVTVELQGLYQFPNLPNTVAYESAMEEDDVFTVDSEQSNTGTESPSGHNIETEHSLHSDVTSRDMARSTLADALFPPADLPAMCWIFFPALTQMGPLLRKSRKVPRSISFVILAEQL